MYVPPKKGHVQTTVSTPKEVPAPQASYFYVGLVTDLAPPVWSRILQRRFQFYDKIPVLCGFTDIFSVVQHTFCLTLWEDSTLSPITFRVFYRGFAPRRTPRLARTTLDPSGQGYYLHPT